MELELVAAFGKNAEMGIDLKLPWNLPSDLKHFKELTSGGVLIMGRKTFDSLPGILPGRPHIVMTRNHSSTSEQGNQVHFVSSVDDLRKLLEDKFQGVRAFVIGGAEIYKLLAPFTRKAFISHVECSCSADTFFPIDMLENFSKKVSIPVTKSEKDQYDYSITCYESEI